MQEIQLDYISRGTKVYKTLPEIRWYVHALVALILAVVVGASFSNAYKMPPKGSGISTMTLDNKYIIEEYYKTLMRSDPSYHPVSWKQINYMFTKDYWWPKGISGLYRPIATFSYWVDYAVIAKGKKEFKTDESGTPAYDAQGKPVRETWTEYAWANGRQLDTTSYHTINLIVHWINAVLVYFLALALTRRVWQAALIAALFAAHPITTESVTNIIGRADMFAALSTVGGLLLYLRSTQSQGARALPWLVGLMLVAAFGVFSKESAVAIALVMIVYDIAYRWRFGNAELKGLPPLLGHGVLYLLLVVALIGLPACASWLAVHLGKYKGMSPVVRYGLALLLSGGGAAVYAVMGRSPREIRIAALGGVCLATICACLFVPWYPLIIAAAVAAIELARGSLTSDDARYRVVAHSTLYLPLYFGLIALPIAAMWYFQHLGWDQWTPAVGSHLSFRILRWEDFLARILYAANKDFYQEWVERYIRVLVIFSLALVLHLLSTSPRFRARINKLLDAEYFPAEMSRSMRALSLCGVAIATVILSLLSYWAGILLAIIVALHEAILGSLTSRQPEYRRDWRLVWNGFSIGYLAIIPPLVAMFAVRTFVVFAPPTTPPETPFLDNPIRGISEIADLNIPEFEQQLAAKPVLGISLFERKMTAVKAMGMLLYRLAWPSPGILCSDYSWSQIPNFSWHLHRLDDWKAIGALITLIVVFILLPIWAYRRSKPVFFFALFFFAAALPTSNFFITIGSVMAERFMYLPLAGFTGVVVLAIYGAARRFWDFMKFRDADDVHWDQILAGTLLAVLICVCGIATYFRNPVWESDLTLWTDAIKKAPQSFRCYQSLAFANYEQFSFMAPKVKDAKQLEPLVDKVYTTAEGARPIVDPLPNHLNSSRLYLHLGMYYTMKAELLSHAPDGSPLPNAEAGIWYQKAVEVLRRASEIDRSFNQVNSAKQRKRGDPPAKVTDVGLTPVYGSLGMAYLRLDMDQEAINAFQYQRQLEPFDGDPYINLANVYMKEQKNDLAAVVLIETLLVDPTRRQVWPLLAQYFSSKPEAAGAAGYFNGQFKLIVSHPFAKQLLTQAYMDLLRVLRRAHRFDTAREYYRAAIERHNLSRDLFDKVMNEPINVVTPDGVQPEVLPPFDETK